MKTLETIVAFGHKNLLCTHGTTIELTKDTYLSKKGNCILGIKASKACSDLNMELKKLIMMGRKIKISINVDHVKDSFYGYGCEELTLSNKKDIVFRKSNFICDRTALIKCTKSAIELNREFIRLLKYPGKKMTITFELDESNE